MHYIKDITDMGNTFKEILEIARYGIVKKYLLSLYEKYSSLSLGTHPNFHFYVFSDFFDCLVGL